MKKIHPIVWAILCLPVVYFAMVTASVYIPGESIFALLERISTIVRRPDLLRWTAYTPRFLLVFLLLYGGGVLLYYADHENRRPGEEYGSAKWGNARELNKRYADQNGKNVILTKRVSIGLDGYKHRRNLNILVVGGSGSGKTRFFCKPGIMSVNCSYLIVDPKGEMLRSTGYLLKDEGYDIMRTLTTESTAVLLPFKTQEIMDTGGLYYGVNAVSRNLIICNRDAMLNGHGLYTGVSGSGKSMMAKQEIGFVGLNTDHDIIVVDPEREYGPLIRALGGEVITISASNGSYVNALDISKEYGDGRNPLVLKSEFIMSLCEQLMGAGEIGAKEKSIIDRCTANIYRKYIRRYEGDPPTLKDLYDDLMRQKEPVAHEIALALELFTTGSLNVFAHQTNIDTRNRIICYDIQDLGENLKPIGLLVMLDSILNRVIRNRQQGRYTHVYIDEIYLFFASPGVGGKSAINNYSSEFLYKCWKRFRKYYATLTGITQNVEECLLSDTARLMFANSEFLVLLNQAPTDRAELAKLLDASDAQMDYVSDAPAGHGLIKVGSCLVPFINELPHDTELYRLMTTKPGEQNA